MPSERSARVTQRRFVRNRAVRRALRTYRTRAARALIEGASSMEEDVRQALRALDKAARKGVIHRNRAARAKSRLTRRFNARSAQTPAP